MSIYHAYLFVHTEAWPEFTAHKFLHAPFDDQNIPWLLLEETPQLAGDFWMWTWENIYWDPDHEDDHDHLIKWCFRQFLDNADGFRLIVTSRIHDKCIDLGKADPGYYVEYVPTTIKIPHLRRRT